MVNITDKEVEQLAELNGLGISLNHPMVDVGSYQLMVALIGINGIQIAIDNMKIELAKRQMDKVNEPDPEVEKFYRDDEDEDRDLTTMLGKRYMDELSALVGTVIMVATSIDGTSEALLQPKVLADNKLPERVWVNIDRLNEV